MKRLIPLGFILTALTALADGPPAPQKFKLVLPAGDSLEQCATLKVGEKRVYEWKSDRPMDFNVHYHQDKKVVFPVQKKDLAADKDTFVSKSDETYCWMWTAGKFPTHIEGTIAAP
jgi:hypothetical protein